jgi:16S rRNA (guanine1207-N2)-methyltransferase
MAGPGTPHYFEREPTSATRRRSIDLVLPDVTLRLVTDRSVFAATAIDPGTKRLLLDAPALDAAAVDTTAGVDQEPTGDLLDLGCGYGPIALTMASRAPDATVWAVDVNLRALDLCRENARANGLTNLRVCEPLEVPPDIRFSTIWSNPPIRIGKEALHATLVRWLDRLTVDGTAVLVAQQHLGSDSLARWLNDNGWRARRLSSRAGYRLLEITRG